MTRRLSRRPNRSPTYPASPAPMIVPQSAQDTVTPSVAGLRWKTWVSAWVVPAMTAVSKPKSRPPRAATRVLITSTAVIFTGAASWSVSDSSGVCETVCIRYSQSFRQTIPSHYIVVLSGIDSFLYLVCTTLGKDKLRLFSAPDGTENNFRREWPARKNAISWLDVRNALSAG